MENMTLQTMTDSLVCYIVGDNESVLLLLLIPRLSYKTELLQSQLKQKVHFVFVFLEFFLHNCTNPFSSLVESFYCL